MVALSGNETDLRAVVAREPGNPAALGALGVAMLQRLAAATGGPAVDEFGAAVMHSTLARRGITAARKYAAERGYEPTADGIRRFRRDVTNALRAAPHPQAMPAQQWGVTLSHDFYSLSMCRDLVFHVQERTYTLPEIADMIAALGLRLVDFAVASPSILRTYHAQFPDDRTALSLGNWAAFEQANPSAFRSMYHFAVQKPAARA